MTLIYRNFFENFCTVNSAITGTCFYVLLLLIKQIKNKTKAKRQCINLQQMVFVHGRSRAIYGQLTRADLYTTHLTRMNGKVTKE